MTKTIAMNTAELTPQDFIEKVVDYKNKPSQLNYLGDKPAIINFYADGCKPCKNIEKILSEISKKFKSKLHVYKINIDREPELSILFGIGGLPTLVLIPQNEEPKIIQGNIPKKDLIAIIERILVKSSESK
ncbi:MAG: thioredoxin fold domain-containing protein [Bacteroidales bacterium]|jgi:thiol-disulfide isomerase/thioredoxin|nr:thioredoxin fold domain-containing protein [Bacteroidales bacterium]